MFWGKFRGNVCVKFCAWLPSCSCKSPCGGSSSAPSSPPSHSASHARWTWTWGTSDDGECRSYCKTRELHSFECIRCIFHHHYSDNQKDVEYQMIGKSISHWKWCIPDMTWVVQTLDAGWNHNWDIAVLKYKALTLGPVQWERWGSSCRRWRCRSRGRAGPWADVCQQLQRRCTHRWDRPSCGQHIPDSLAGPWYQRGLPHSLEEMWRLVDGGNIQVNHLGTENILHKHYLVTLLRGVFFSPHLAAPDLQVWRSPPRCHAGTGRTCGGSAGRPASCTSPWWSRHGTDPYRTAQSHPWSPEKQT